jgi:hypothetical protein
MYNIIISVQPDDKYDVEANNSGTMNLMFGGCLEM